jgi:hypothetical protein
MRKLEYVNNYLPCVNDNNYLPCVHTVTIGLGERSKLEYVTGELQKSELTNPNFPNAQEKKKALKEWRAYDFFVTN